MEAGGKKLRRSYRRKFADLLDPRTLVSFSVLRFPTKGLNDRERDGLQRNLLGIGATSVFLGRIELLQGSVKKQVDLGRLPPEAASIENFLMGNSIIVFSKSCAEWWSNFFKKLKVQSEFDGLTVLAFFVGCHKFPFELLDHVPASFHCKEHSQLDENTTGQTPHPDNEDITSDSFYDELYCDIRLLGSGVINCSHLNIFRSIRAVSGGPETMSNKIGRIIEEFVRDIVTSLKGVKKKADLVKKLLEYWTGLNVSLVLLEKFFGKSKCIATAHKYWSCHVLLDPNIKRMVVGKLISCFGENMSMESLVNMLTQLLESDVYCNDFEKPFLEGISQHCLRKSTELLEGSAFQEYLQMVDQYVCEKVHIFAYLPESTMDKLAVLVWKAMILDQLQWLRIFYTDGTAHKLRMRFHQFSDIYKLCSSSANVLKPFQSILKEQFMLVFSTLVPESKISNPSVLFDLVKQLTSLIFRASKLIEVSFFDDPVFTSDLHCCVSDATKFVLDNLRNATTEASQIYEGCDKVRMVARGICIRSLKKSAKVLEDSGFVADMRDAAVRKSLILVWKTLFVDQLVWLRMFYVQGNVHDLSVRLDIFSHIYLICSAASALCLSPFRSLLKEQFMLAFSALVQDMENTSEPCMRSHQLERLTSLISRAFQLIEAPFLNDPQIIDDLRCYVSDVIRFSGATSALFIHECLQNAAKGAFQSIEGFDRLHLLVDCLVQRDIFEAHYMNLLCTRLLSDTVNVEAERGFHQKIKSCSTYIFNGKIDIMLVDIEHSEKITAGLEDTLADLRDSPSLSVKVIHKQSWPTVRVDRNSSCRLPDELSVFSDKLRAYYLNTYSPMIIARKADKVLRKLTWLTSEGTATIVGTFGPGNIKYEFCVSTQQCCILVLFNRCDVLSFEEIRESTELPSDNLRLDLSAICESGVLTKQSSERGDEVELFSVNDSFSSSSYKIRICDLAKSQPLKDISNQRIKQNRKPQLEAAIVRVMKARRRIRYTDLVREVTSQVARFFVPDKDDIKGRVDELIDREYIRRDAYNPFLFHYIE